MSEETDFIPYEVAMQIIGNVVEEEHLHKQNTRILTVYDKEGAELCWYDAEDVLSEAKPSNPKDPENVKAACVEVVMNQIPKWALEALLKRKEQQEKNKSGKDCDGKCAD